MNRDWLETLQAGDKVFLYDPTPSVQVVKRTTKTTFIITYGPSSERKIRRSNGHELGSRYHGAWIDEYKPEKEQEIRDASEKRRLVNKMRETQWKYIALDRLRRINAIIQEESQ